MKLEFNTLHPYYIIHSLPFVLHSAERKLVFMREYYEERETRAPSSVVRGIDVMLQLAAYLHVSCLLHTYRLPQALPSWLSRLMSGIKYCHVRYDDGNGFCAM